MTDPIDPDSLNSVQQSIEQQFEQRSFALKVKSMTTEQVKGSLISLFNQMMLRENSYKERLKKQWGIEPKKLT